MKRRSPITTWTPPPTRAIPSRRAAVDPRTTAGYRAEAASRKTPSASVAPTVTGSDGSAARVVSPFVSVLGISSERKTGRVDRPGRRDRLDRADPADHRARLVGQRRRLAEDRLPGETVSRFVPSRSSDDRRSALLDSEIASTATIAAIPIAIPRPESAARSLRAERPTAPTRRTSRGASGSVRAPSRRRLRVELDEAVAELDASRQRLGELALVRDHDDRRPRAIQLAEERDDTPAGTACRGSPSARRRTGCGPPDDGPGDGDTLALAAGQLVGPVVKAVREPDVVERLLGARPALAERQAGVERPSATLSSAERPSSRKNCWKRNRSRAPGAPRAAVGQLRRGMPVDADRPGRRAARACRARGGASTCRSPTADDPEQLALLDRERDAAQRGDVGPVALLEPGASRTGVIRRPPRSRPAATPASISTYAVGERPVSTPVSTRSPLGPTTSTAIAAAAEREERLAARRARLRALALERDDDRSAVEPVALRRLDESEHDSHRRRRRARPGRSSRPRRPSPRTSIRAVNDASRRQLHPHRPADRGQLLPASRRGRLDGRASSR